MTKIATAYGIPTLRINEPDFARHIDTALFPAPAHSWPMLSSTNPKPSSRDYLPNNFPDGRMVTAPLEDMFPFLSREELADNLLVPPEKE